MSIDALFTQINKLAETHAQAEVCRRHGADRRHRHRTRQPVHPRRILGQRGRHPARGVDRRTGHRDPPTVYAQPDPHAPVRMLDNQHIGVEVRGSLGGARAVSIRYTRGQAVTVGTAIIACACVMQERGGGPLTAIVPPIPTHAGMTTPPDRAGPGLSPQLTRVRSGGPTPGVG
jgi:hypothetical protein